MKCHSWVNVLKKSIDMRRIIDVTIGTFIGCFVALLCFYHFVVYRLEIALDYSDQNENWEQTRDDWLEKYDKQLKNDLFGN